MSYSCSIIAIPSDIMFSVIIDDLYTHIYLQELVRQVEKTTNVVDSTNQPNLYEKLETLQDNLSLCEKALAEYLETKRLAFPRFYFVSSADLLDILSNGNDPVTVSCHLMLKLKVSVVGIVIFGLAMKKLTFD